MKLIIQIPCFNEEQTLGVTLRDLPRSLDGVDVVEWLVIDDGSTDRTVAIAEQFGVDHVIRFRRNQGLARAFSAGIEACLERNADLIVNTDADNQYAASDIAKLLEPILAKKADIVVGARPISDTPHFSRLKKCLQRIGSWVVRLASRTDIPDAPSGFRAYTREAASRLRILHSYTYTLESIIQAGQQNMAITWVPIRTNGDLRPSRLMRSIPSYIAQSASTIVRIFMTYRPFRFFAIPGTATAFLGLIIAARFLYFYITDGGVGHIQSLLFSTTLIAVGCGLVVTGLVADLISVNRKLLERLDDRLRRLETIQPRETLPE